ncbi:PH domain-containing protein [Canibacter sp. lx-45]|uniref:PH domain-containing protein n=1 Tax=Canibacter zhuwentaonis TaxID=2837491 RepID=UPI001BDD839C|nr:PH domain-containing protein [Canibacter zhuwentaonis]MBT1035542.1 PH domain-containing protein [Canibacter zhuwentaonis]
MTAQQNFEARNCAAVGLKSGMAGVPEQSAAGVQQQSFVGALEQSAAPAYHSAVVIAGDPEWRRLHPLSPLLDLLLTVGVLIGIVIINFRDTLVEAFLLGSNAGGAEVKNVFEHISTMSITTRLVLGAVIALLLFIIVYGVLSWRFTRYRVYAGQIEINQGILTKKYKALALNKIVGVDVERRIAARIMGLAVIKIVSASDEIILSALSHGNAKEARADLLRLVAVAKREQEGVAGASGQTDAVADDPLQGVQNAHLLDRVVHSALDRDVSATAVRDKTLLQVPVKMLLLATLARVAPLALLFAGAVSALFVFVQGEARESIILTSVSSLVPVAFGVAAFFVKHINEGYGFVIGVSNSQIRISAGLSTIKAETLPLDKIHTVQVVQPFLWRFFGWYMVEAVSSGVNKQSESLTQFNGKSYTALPVGRAADMRRVVQLLLGERYSEEIFAAQRRGAQLSYAAAKRAVPLIVLSASNEGAEVFGDRAENHVFASRGGFFTNRIAYMLPAKAQAVVYRSGPLLKLLGLAKVSLVRRTNTLFYDVAGLPKNQAKELFEKLAEVLAQSDSVEPGDAAGKLNLSAQTVENVLAEVVDEQTA